MYRILVPVTLILLTFLYSCQKKDEEAYVPPGQEIKKDPEQERLEREEFERLKRLEMGIDSASTLADTSAVSDSAKVAQNEAEKKKLVQKEKELNKRLDNPKIAVTDYLEFLQRATSGGNFEQNIKKASEQWQKSNPDRFRRNYKDTKKIVIVEEPKVVSQNNDEAQVDVKIKKIDMKDGKEVETSMSVRYILAADSKGKWKIKDNKVTTN